MERACHPNTLLPAVPKETHTSCSDGRLRSEGNLVSSYLLSICFMTVHMKAWHFSNNTRFGSESEKLFLRLKTTSHS